MDWIPQYIKRKHGQEEVKHLHEDLEPILGPTYGIGVYQEQILQIAQAFAGFTLGEADILRRAIGKKIMKELKAQREKFIVGAEKKGYKKKLAEEIFDDVITPFAGYGFNKSHAAGYALIAYQTAYLKARFPTEFMAALLSSDAQKTDRVMIEIEECRQMGIAVLPPDINESLRHFTAIVPEKSLVRGISPRGSIRFGLSAIKGIGESTVIQIIEVRDRGGPFASIENFAKRMPSKVLNKKTIEALTKSGALDSLGDRKILLDNYEKIADFCKASGDASHVQGDLFGNTSEGISEAKIDFADTPPATSAEKLAWEKETLGMYVSSHPLAGLRKYIGKKAQLIATLTPKDADKHVTIAGIEEGLKKIMTKKGDTMAILTLEDPTGKIEVTLFPKTYAEAASLFGRPDTVLVIRGTLDQRGGQLQLRAEALKKASLSTMVKRAKEEGFFDEEEAKSGIMVRPQSSQEDETVELVDEEGNIIAGEQVTLGKEQASDDFFGPLGKWIMAGMPVETPLKALEAMAVASPAPVSDGAKAHSATDHSPDLSIHIHTVELPPRAPRQLLLELKKIFETFPGKEKVQLKIGEQLIPLPITITMSTILEKKIEEAIAACTPKP
jgi:DNA polymerase-3 subunit alpha